MKKHSSKTFHQVLAMLLCAALLLPMLPALPVRATEEVSAVTDQPAETLDISKILSYYSGGTKSSTVEFDCGNGLTGGGEKSYMTMYTGTTATHFSNFQTKLKDAGYVVKSEHTIASNSSSPNSFGSYITPGGSYKVYAYFFPDYGETRIIVDTQKDTVEGYQYTPQTGKSVEPKLVMWGMSMSPIGYGIGELVSPNQEKKLNCGGMVVIRMPDNSLFIHDGGDYRQMNDEACDDFLAFCRELTDTPAGEKMVVNTWFMSHAHRDHYQGFYRFINKYHDQFDLKNVMYTIDKERSGDNYDITGLTKLLSEAYPDVRYYKPHTGESINIAGVTLDVIYTLEDRFLPNSSNQLIIDTDNKGGTYRDGMYKNSSTKTYDFNDTSTIIRITFDNGVNSILYADATRAKTVYTTVYPTSFLKTDIMMIPHHGHNEHTDLVSYADAKVYLYTQHKNAAYGPDNDVSTLDMYGTYREAVRDKFIAMFPDMNVPAGTENVDYDIFWAGNETVTIDVNQLGEVINGTSTAKYYTSQPAHDFEYTGWGITDLCSDPVNPSDMLLSAEDVVTLDTQAVTTTTIRYNPVGTGKLTENGRYIIKHNNTNFIMSYDAVALSDGRPCQATSLFPTTENPVNASASNIYYETEKGVYLEHSNRALAMWILHQEGTTTDATLSTGPLGAMFGGKAYGEVWLNKGNATEYDADGNKTAGRNGVYWNAVYGQDSNSPATQYRYLDPRYADEQWVKTSEPTGDDATDPKMRYVIEDLGDGSFLIYWRSKSGQTMGFLTCDEAGNWGVKLFTDATTDFHPAVPKAGSAELENLKLSLYQYKVFNDLKYIQFSGAQTYNVVEGTTLDQVLANIQENISLTDTTRRGFGIPCNGTSSKIGYYYLKFNNSFDSTAGNSYTVSVLFRNDDNTDTQLATLNVNVLEDPNEGKDGALIADKTISAGQNENEYTLTLEAYATGTEIILSDASVIAAPGSGAMLKEVLSDYFDFADADVQVYTAAYSGKGEFADDSSYGPRVKLTGANVQISASQEGGRLDVVTVSGFDYSEQYLSAKSRNGSYGSKLIVEFTIRARDGFWGGNNVPSSKDGAGIYAADNALVAAFPTTEINVQSDVSIDVKDMTIYYDGVIDRDGDGNEGDDLLDQVAIGGVEVIVNNDGSFTPAETWMDDYASAGWAGGSTRFDADLSNTSPMDYPYAVVVTPNSAGTASDGQVFGAALSEQTTSVNAHIFVLAPGLTFKDSTVAFGSAAEEYSFIAGNYVKTEWVFMEDSADTMWAPAAAGLAPVLDVQYTPDLSGNNSLENGLFITDTKVNVSVSINGKDITNITTFFWESCQHTAANIMTHKGSVDFNEFWVHVTVDMLPDMVVIDNGLDVIIDVLTNDPEVDGIVSSLNGIGTKDATVFGKEDVLGTYGKLSIEGDRVRYRLNDSNGMQMAGEDVFSYQVAYTINGKVVVHHSTITIIPATSIYYEDSQGMVKYHEGDNLVQWQEVGNSDSDTQEQDRPGAAVLEGLDADNIYGFDAGYASTVTYSNGVAHWVRVSRVDAFTTLNARATFTFTGTGFDIVSLCSGATGLVTINVYEETSCDDIIFDDANGNTTQPIVSYTVDTYYQVEGTTLYQVPVIKLDMNDVPSKSDSSIMCGYGTYTVEIYVAPSAVTNDNAYEEAYFYLDAIRIYNPGNNSASIQDAYLADGEAWPSYLELRDVIIEDSSKLEEGVILNNVLFIDGGKNSVAGNTTPSIKEYVNWSTGNEVCLADGQSVAFTLDTANYAGDVAAVHLGMRGLTGLGDVLVTAMDRETGDETILIAKQIGTTNMYYDLTDAMGKVITISNAGATPIAVSNLKITHKSNPGADCSVENIIYSDAVTADMALEMLTPEVLPDPVLTPKYPTLSCEGLVCYNIYFDVQQLGALTGADLGLAVFNTQDADGTVETAQDVIMGANEVDGLYMIATNGIPAKNLGDTLYFRVFAKLADGSYVYSKMVGYSAILYAKSTLSTSNDVKAKRLAVALLNYGAEAQTYFGYRTDALMNRDLTADQQALLDVLDPDLLGTFVGADASKIGAFVSNGGFSKKYPNISLEGAFKVNYFLQPAYEADNGATIYFWSEDTYKSVSKLTMKNADLAVEMTLVDGLFTASSFEIAAKELDQTVYAAVVYKSNGVTYCSGVLAYSIATYCKNPPSADYALADAMAVYSCAAKEFFGV